MLGVTLSTLHFPRPICPDAEKGPFYYRQARIRESHSPIKKAKADDGAVRIRNKAKLKPYDLVDPRNTELRMVLQKAEFASMAGDDIVDEDANDRDNGVTGSPSDSE